MLITKRYLNRVLEETIEEFNKKVYPIDREVKLEYMEKKEYLMLAANNPINKNLINMGVFRNFNREYPSFLVVFTGQDNPIAQMLQLPFKITVCFEMAKDKLKQFDETDVTEFLKHAFAHELTHLMQHRIIKKEPELWNKLRSQALGNEVAGHELLAEYMADRIGDSERYRHVEDRLWGVVRRRMDRMRNFR